MQPEQWLTQVAKRFDKAATTYTQFNKTQHVFAQRLYQRAYVSSLGALFGPRMWAGLQKLNFCLSTVTSI